MPAASDAYTNFAFFDGHVALYNTEALLQRSD